MLRYNSIGQIDLTKLDSEGRTYATYAIEKQSHSCLEVSLSHFQSSSCIIYAHFHTPRCY